MVASLRPDDVRQHAPPEQASAALARHSGGALTDCRLPGAPTALPGAAAPRTPAQRRRGGRPTRPHEWRVHFTAAELAEVRQRTSASGTPSVADYLRRCALGQSLPIAAPAVPALNRQAWGELSKLAGNVNVLGKHVNAGNVLAGPAVGDLFRLLREVHAAVQTLRRALLTGA